MNEARCGPDMPKQPRGLAERAILLLPDRNSARTTLEPLHLHEFGLSIFKPNSERSSGLWLSYQLPVRDSRINSWPKGLIYWRGLRVLLLVKFSGSLESGSVSKVNGFFLVVAAGIIAWTRYKMNVKVWFYSHGLTWIKEKDIDRDKEFDAFISFSFKRSRPRHSGANRGDRREGPGYQVVRSLQTLPPGRIHTKEHHEGSGELQENSPRALGKSHLTADDRITNVVRFIDSLCLFCCYEATIFSEL
ncbi:hypothetical protein CEXT_154621 [Caerostris extrusa]|uniref:Uncharacterized protein n=1 Tax=Caerostris extrusa TaxID=172846 RepID=A0AAV4M7M2_CAEEX|nr:hypothetical protein CEXT_154621 [Caerostris extrusa]